MDGPQVKVQESFLSKYWPLLMLGGLLIVSAAGPELLYRKYGNRRSGRSRKY